jgi:hypothetical protein
MDRGGLGPDRGGLGGNDDFKAPARAPLRAFGGDDAQPNFAPAEAKDGGAEVMSFK